MKFRTDFVTNSSSDSYVVRLKVKTREKSEINLDYSHGETFDDSTCINLKSLNPDEVVKRIQQCKTVSEIADVLQDEYVCDLSLEDFIPDIVKILSERIERDSPSYSYAAIKLMEEIENTSGRTNGEDLEEWECDNIAWILEDIRVFRNGMHSITSLEDITGIEIEQHYSGWGEYAPDCVIEFLNDVIGDEWDTNEVAEVLKDKLTESEIKDITGWLDGTQKGVCPDGSIITVISFPDGTVKKEYSMSI